MGDTIEISMCPEPKVRLQTVDGDNQRLLRKPSNDLGIWDGPHCPRRTKSTLERKANVTSVACSVGMTSNAFGIIPIMYCKATRWWRLRPPFFFCTPYLPLSLVTARWLKEIPQTFYRGVVDVAGLACGLHEMPAVFSRGELQATTDCVSWRWHAGR